MGFKEVNNTSGKHCAESCLLAGVSSAGRDSAFEVYLPRSVCVCVCMSTRGSQSDVTNMYRCIYTMPVLIHMHVRLFYFIYYCVQSNSSSHAMPSAMQGDSKYTPHMRVQKQQTLRQDKRAGCTFADWNNVRRKVIIINASLKTPGSSLCPVRSLYSRARVCVRAHQVLQNRGCPR